MNNTKFKPGDRVYNNHGIKDAIVLNFYVRQKKKKRNVFVDLYILDCSYSWNEYEPFHHTVCWYSAELKLLEGYDDGN